MSCVCARPTGTECIPIKCVTLMRSRFLSALLALSGMLFCSAQAHADFMSVDFEVTTQDRSPHIGLFSVDIEEISQPQVDNPPIEHGNLAPNAVSGSSDFEPPPPFWVGTNTTSETGDVGDSNAPFNDSQQRGSPVDGPRRQGVLSVVHFQQTSGGMRGAAAGSASPSAGTAFGLFSRPILPRAELVDRLLPDSFAAPTAPFLSGLFRPPRVF